MKLDKTRIIALVILGVITFGALGFFIYDALNGEGFDSSAIIRIVIVLLAALGSLVKILRGAKTGGLTPELVVKYKDAYADIIRGGFDDTSKKSREFFTALLLYNKEEYTRAISTLEHIDYSECRQNERFAISFFIALCYDDMGAQYKAIEAYEQLLTVEEHFSVLSNLGILYSKTGRAKLAIEYYKRSLQVNPQNASAYNNLAQSYLEMAHYESVIEPAQKALELDSKMASAYSALAVAFAMLGKDEESESALARCVALGKDRAKLLHYIESLKNG